MLRLLRVTMFSVLFFGTVFAQVQSALQGLALDAGKAYVSPIISGFGSNLNSGWVHRAVDDKILGFDLEVGAVMMGTPFKEVNKNFSISSLISLDRKQATEIAQQLVPGVPSTSLSGLVDSIVAKQFKATISGPTIIGAKDKNVVISITSGQSVTYTPVGGNPQTLTLSNLNNTTTTDANGVLGDLTALPMAAPQLTFGTIYGTSLSIRYLPSIEVSKELGKFEYLGWGIQHNLGMWLPIPYVNLSAAFFTQKMKVGDIFETKATTFGFFASKKFGWGLLSLTPYAGFSMESSNVSITYNYTLVDVPTAGSTKIIPITFSIDGENKTKLTLGASLKILLFNINADYNIATYNTFSAGFSLYL